MDYKKLTESYKNDLLKKLEEFVKIDSVYDEKTKDKNNPFGIGVTNALNYIAEIAKNDNFVSTNYDNMIVEILAGTGKKNITILAHADVVPAGSGWNQDPFSVVEKEGVLYGRGVADDKGPLLSCYYGLKALRDNNLLGDYTVRFLVGGNEESGSLGVDHYFHTLKKPQPDLGFSPDSSYPLIYAEKGITNFKVEKEVKNSNIISIHGGVASNSVIEKCVALIKRDNAIIDFLKNNNYNFSFNEKGDEIELIFHGKAAHGSIPWEGDNAGMHCLDALGKYYQDKDLKMIAEKYSFTKGEGIKADAYSTDMKDNSLNVGLIDFENNHFEMVVNFRYTNVCDYETLKKTIEENSSPFKVTFLINYPVLYYPIDSVLVSTLLKVYQDETGDFSTPALTTGGGTYAKEADNVIAFGMEFPGWDSHMHSPGECCKISHLVDSMAIYAHAIVELGKKL